MTNLSAPQKERLLQSLYLWLTQSILITVVSYVWYELHGSLPKQELEMTDRALGYLSFLGNVLARLALPVIIMQLILPKILLFKFPTVLLMLGNLMIFYGLSVLSFYLIHLLWPQQMVAQLPLELYFILLTSHIAALFFKRIRLMFGGTD